MNEIATKGLWVRCGALDMPSRWLFTGSFVLSTCVFWFVAVRRWA